jgi:hypothetical protein
MSTSWERIDCPKPLGDTTRWDEKASLPGYL